MNRPACVLEGPILMFDPCRHPAALKALYVLALGRAFLRHRNPRRRAIGRHQVEFYDRVWREAAARLGASFVPLGAGISEIRLGGVTHPGRARTPARSTTP